MKQNTPLVSVIMLMKNAESFVVEAIESVLSQTFNNLELIVVDDQSSDNSRSLVEEINDSRFIIINGEGKGVATAFNTALGIAKGDYICRCDADDLFPQTRLAKQVLWLQSHLEFGAVCGRYESMDQKGNHVSTFLCGSDKEEEITSELMTSETRTSLCTFLIDRNVMVELNGCRSFFITSSDIDLQLRLAMKIKIAFIPENTYYYRLHDTSITHTQASNQRVFFETTARLFQQQRLATGSDDLERGMPPVVPKKNTQESKVKAQISNLYISEAWRLHRQGEKYKAIKKGILACSAMPFSYSNWRNVLFLIIKN